MGSALCRPHRRRRACRQPITLRFASTCARRRALDLPFPRSPWPAIILLVRAAGAIAVRTAASTGRLSGDVDPRRWRASPRARRGSRDHPQHAGQQRACAASLATAAIVCVGLNLVLIPIGASTVPASPRHRRSSLRRPSTGMPPARLLGLNLFVLWNLWPEARLMLLSPQHRRFRPPTPPPRPSFSTPSILPASKPGP